MSTYNFSDIESKWQKTWEEKRLFEADGSGSKPKYYCLVMFPYPSGKLHMGHVRNYSIGDVFARFYRMSGRSVLHPIGWDAFGLPAENAAIKNRTSPSAWTRENIRQMGEQLKALGISYDWSRELATCDPEYYRWNQWFFIKMWEKGLVLRRKAAVNWCPSCATVLANEQVNQGRCWRCDSIVENKELEQWFLKITDYAEELLKGHEELEKGWPQEVLAMQKNWIGRSVGAEVKFRIVSDDGKFENDIEIFTTRPDTLFGATFMVLAPEHGIMPKLEARIRNADEVRGYVREAAGKSSIERTGEREKTGLKLEGVGAVNPVNG
ncbi:MAG: class I tRNA ligase family protein, partial [Endomicrobiales bacterium]|nr:class I tRNA ligase family protein [Endomicrobiales bacterium]